VARSVRHDSARRGFRAALLLWHNAAAAARGSRAKRARVARSARTPLAAPPPPCARCARAQSGCVQAGGGGLAAALVARSLRAPSLLGSLASLARYRRRPRALAHIARGALRPPPPYARYDSLRSLKPPPPLTPRCNVTPRVRRCARRERSERRAQNRTKLRPNFDLDVVE